MDRITEAFLTSDERRTHEALTGLAGDRVYLAWEDCCTLRAEGFERRSDALGQPFSEDDHAADCPSVAEWKRAQDALDRFETEMAIKYAK